MTSDINPVDPLSATFMYRAQTAGAQHIAPGLLTRKESQQIRPASLDDSVELGENEKGDLVSLALQHTKDKKELKKKSGKNHLKEWFEYMFGANAKTVYSSAIAYIKGKFGDVLAGNPSSLRQTAELVRVDVPGINLTPEGCCSILDIHDSGNNPLQADAFPFSLSTAHRLY